MHNSVKKVHLDKPLNISLIAAVSRNWVIGYDNRLAWHIPGELKYFKKITWGKPVIMGRKTYQSIGSPLPGRDNLILTRQHWLRIPGVQIFHDIASILEYLPADEECMVIGGTDIYERFMPLANRMYITWIEHDFKGSSFFPVWPTDEWQEITRQTHQPTINNPYLFSYCIFERIKPAKYVDNESS